MKPFVGRLHESTQPPHRNPYYSEDGNWRYDGSQWVSTLSPDGLWRFDGTSWVPSSPYAQPAQPVQAGGAHGVGVKFTQVPIPAPIPFTPAPKMGGFAIFAIIFAALAGGVILFMIILANANGSGVYLDADCHHHSACAQAVGGGANTWTVSQYPDAASCQSAADSFNSIESNLPSFAPAYGITEYCGSQI
jgi:hypothetical protein